MLNYISIIFLFFSLSFQSHANATAIPEHSHLPAIEQKSLTFVAEDVVPPKSRRSSDVAKEIIHSIVSSVGLKANFEIREAKISNAAAVNYKGKRFILYDAEFIDRIQNATQTDWAAVSILAHEIGHHLNGHTMLGKASDNPALELEADEFSGFILRQMGASLKDAQKALRLMSSVRESASHPARNARMAAIEKGYISANDRIMAYSDQANAPMVASFRSGENAREVEAPKEQYSNSLAEENIYKEVHFSMLPNHTFYLTHQLKLVTLTDMGPAVLGKISKNKNRLMLTVYNKKGGANSFYVSEKGMLVDEANKVIGYIKNKA